MAEIRNERNTTGGGEIENLDELLFDSDDEKLARTIGITALDGLPFGPELGRYDIQVTIFSFIYNPGKFV